MFVFIVNAWEVWMISSPASLESEFWIIPASKQRTPKEEEDSLYSTISARPLLLSHFSLQKKSPCVPDPVIHYITITDISDYLLLLLPIFTDLRISKLYTPLSCDSQRLHHFDLTFDRTASSHRYISCLSHGTTSRSSSALATRALVNQV